MKQNNALAAKSMEKSAKPEDYEIKDAADTLMRAEEIKKDKRLMPHVHKHLHKKVKQIKSIQDIRDAAKEMSAKDEDKNV